MTSNEYDHVERAAATVRGRLRERPAVAVVLGSGLGGFAEIVQRPIVIPYDEIPFWPVSRVPGHAGRLLLGTVGGRSVAVLAGRCHLYEGHEPASVTFGVRVMGRVGVRTIVLTNAAGGINLAFARGTLMVIDDHINLTGSNPLVGVNDERFGSRFPDMSEVYSARLRRFADEAAGRVSVPLAHGVYAGLLGPSYETPAEIRYLRAVGADAVGMSTVHEAIVARHMGMEVLGVSCITNMAAGVLPGVLDHADVVATGARAQAGMSALVAEIVRAM